MREQTMGPTFEGTSCVLPHLKKAGRHLGHGSVRVDLSAFSMAPDSLLMLVIASSHYPLSASHSFKFRRALQAICNNPVAVKILNSRPCELSSRDVIHLFNCIEDEIQLHWGKSSKRDGSGQARHLLLAFPDVLSDGATIRTCGFKTRFKAPARKQQKTSSSLTPFYKNKNEPSESTPSDLFLNIQFNSFEERNKQAFTASKKRNEKIAALCLDSFSQYKAASDLILNEKARGNIDLKLVRSRRVGRLSRTSFKGLNEDEQLRYLVNLIESENWYAGTPIDLSDYPLDKIEKLAFNQRIDTNKIRKELLFCDYYLPKSVVAACCVAIQNDTALNTEVIESLTAGDIEKTKKGYKITGVKGKTDQIISKEIPINNSEPEGVDISGEAGIKAIQLLLSNAENIKKNLGIEFIPLLSTLNLRFHTRKPIQFTQQCAYDLIRFFCKSHDLINFNTRYLRHLTLQTHSLSPAGNIYSTQALANHASISTTDDYIFTTVLSSLYTANIRRFMDMMAASILWRTNRNGLLEKSGLNKRGFDLNILFPLKWSENNGDSMIDHWIDSSFKEKISLGLDEFYQNKIQYEYYIQNIQKLSGENYTQFVYKHLPRILTCISLHRIILLSPFAHFYRNI